MSPLELLLARTEQQENGCPSADMGLFLLALWCDREQPLSLLRATSPCFRGAGVPGDRRYFSGGGWMSAWVPFGTRRCGGPVLTSR